MEWITTHIVVEQIKDDVHTFVVMSQGHPFHHLLLGSQGALMHYSCFIFSH